MRVFCPEPLNAHNIYQPFLFRFAPEAERPGIFNEDLPPNYFKEQVVYVEKPEEAEAIVLPNNFVRTDGEVEAYVQKFADTAERLRIPIFVFSCGDHSDSVPFDPRATVIRYSLYASSVQPRDVSAPTLTADIGRGGVEYRVKGEVPTVSFCGKAGFSSPREAAASWVRRLKYEVFGLLRPAARARIRGVFWRKWALRACRRSPLVKTLFITRKSFSGAQRTIELDPKKAREDFIGSVQNADFVLAPKGDGNYSNRFLEALSMGRIPVLIDTDVVLPLEDTIDYRQIVVRVPMREVKRIPECIRAFYDSLSEEEWRMRQMYAREVFEKYLRQDSFWREFFNRALSPSSIPKNSSQDSW